MIVKKAISLAFEYHFGQKRKLGGKSIMEHLFHVATLVSQYTDDKNIVAAAILHDVVEDTDCTEETLKKEIGEVVADLVMEVTEEKELPWEQRKQKYIDHLHHASSGARLICAADKVDNLLSLKEEQEIYGEDMWKSFNANKERSFWFFEEVLSALKDKGAHPLLDMYEKTLSEVKNS